MTCVRIRIAGNSTTGQEAGTGYAHDARHTCAGTVNFDQPRYGHRSGRVPIRTADGTSANARNVGAARSAAGAIDTSRIMASTGHRNSAIAHHIQRRRCVLSASGARHDTCDQSRNAVCASTTGSGQANSDRKHWTLRSAKFAVDPGNSSRRSLSKGDAGHATATGGITARRKNDRRICGEVVGTDIASAGIRQITK